MKFLLCLIVVLFFSACGTPPAQPAFLWESISPSHSPSESGSASDSSSADSAKSLPAQNWEGPSDNSDGTSDTRSDAGTETAAEPENLPEDSVPEDSVVVGSVVINEIYYDAVGSDTDGLLFVELFGTPDLLIGGLKINFVDGGDGSVDDSITLPELARIGLDGYYVIADLVTGSTQVTQVAEFDLLDTFDPQNGPDAVQLLDPEGRLLDAVAYGEVPVLFAENGLSLMEGASAPDVLNGHSIERKTPGQDTDDNLMDFEDRMTPTPGW